MYSPGSAMLRNSATSLFCSGATFDILGKPSALHHSCTVWLSFQQSAFRKFTNITKYVQLHGLIARTHWEPLSSLWKHSKGPRPISILRLWISEGLTQAEYQFKGVEFSGT